METYFQGEVVSFSNTDSFFWEECKTSKTNPKMCEFSRSLSHHLHKSEYKKSLRCLLLLTVHFPFGSGWFVVFWSAGVCDLNQMQARLRLCDGKWAGTEGRLTWTLWGLYLTQAPDPNPLLGGPDRNPKAVTNTCSVSSILKYGNPQHCWNSDSFLLLISCVTSAVSSHTSQQSRSDKTIFLLPLPSRKEDEVSRDLDLALQGKSLQPGRAI